MILFRYELLVFKSIVLRSCFHINFRFSAWKFISKRT